LQTAVLDSTTSVIFVLDPTTSVILDQRHNHRASDVNM